MKYKYRHSIILLVITLILNSCRVGNHFLNESDTNEIPDVVTNIYDPVECDLPAGYTFLDDVTPFFDEYSGTLSIIGKCGTEIIAEDDSVIWQYTYSLFTYDVNVHSLKIVMGIEHI